MIDESRAVVSHLHQHARRQFALINLVDLGLERRDDGGGIAPLKHVDDTFHHVVVAVERDVAGTRPTADVDVRHVAHQNRGAIIGRDGHSADVVDGLKIAEATYHQGLVASTHDAAASIRAVVLQRLTHLRQRDIESAQLLGVARDLIFLDCPTETDLVGNARDAAYGGAYHPFFLYAYVFDRHRRRCLRGGAGGRARAGRGRGGV